MTKAASAIARDFVSARLGRHALAAFPGSLPETLDEAYAIQDLAIRAWPDRIVGWKIGRVPPEFETRVKAQRVFGPIFSEQIRQAQADRPVRFPVFPGGFAAVEAEIVLRRDGPSDWTAIAGIETAGSPLKAINEIGPIAVASDFGNNAGLILGAEIPRAGFEVTTIVDGVVVGRGAPDETAIMDALASCLEHCAKRGFPIPLGAYVTTGALTGVHDILPGQSASIAFGGFNRIECRAI